MDNTGSELWKTDGTVDGTAIVKDMVPGANGGIAAFAGFLALWTRRRKSRA